MKRTVGKWEELFSLTSWSDERGQNSQTENKRLNDIRLLSVRKAQRKADFASCFKGCKQSVCYVEE